MRIAVITTVSMGVMMMVRAMIRHLKLVFRCGRVEICARTQERVEGRYTSLEDGS